MNTTTESLQLNPPLTLTAANFSAEALQPSTLVLVDFWAPWCGPCRMVAPLIDELATEFAGRAKVTKLNVDEYPAIASQFGITSIPALVIFKNGQVVDRLVGLTSRRTLAAKLTAQLN